MTLHTLYSFTVTPSDKGHDIVLSHNTDPKKVKRFFLAKGHSSTERLINHMNSLTDELCDGFFPQPRVKKVRKEIPTKE